MVDGYWMSRFTTKPRLGGVLLFLRLVNVWMLGTAYSYLGAAMALRVRGIRQRQALSWLKFAALRPINCFILLECRLMQVQVSDFNQRLVVAVNRQVAGESASASKDQAFAGMRVALSPEGLARAAQERDADIDASDLPDTLKNLLKAMRDLRAQLAAKAAELQALLSETGLSDEQRKAQLDVLRQAMTSLQGALMTLGAQLGKAMQTMPLSDEQRLTVGKLLLAR
jgi:hypothetical protein